MIIRNFFSTALNTKIQYILEYVCMYVCINSFLCSKTICLLSFANKRDCFPELIEGKGVVVGRGVQSILDICKISKLYAETL